MQIDGLTAPQLAEVGRAIGRAGFSASEFHSEDIPSTFGGPVEVPGLVHRSGAWFAFAREYRSYSYSDQLHDIGHHASFSPGSLSPVEEQGPLEWPGMLAALQAWLRNMRAALDAVDFATAVEQGATELAVGKSELDDRPFTAVERSAIERQLDEMESAIAAAATKRADDMDYIRTQFEGLREELARMKRGRWKQLLLGTGVSFAARQVVPPDVAQTAVHAVMDAVRRLPELLTR